jgi:hypothetical protein
MSVWDMWMKLEEFMETENIGFTSSEDDDKAVIDMGVMLAVIEPGFAAADRRNDEIEDSEDEED